MGIWATNLLHRFSDAMQLCCALESGTFFLKILLCIAVMAMLSSIPPLANSRTSNKHFELTRHIFKYDILSAIDSYPSHLVTRGKSFIRYVCMLRNYLYYRVQRLSKLIFPRKTQKRHYMGILTSVSTSALTSTLASLSASVSTFTTVTMLARSLGNCLHLLYCKPLSLYVEKQLSLYLGRLYSTVSFLTCASVSSCVFQSQCLHHYFCLVNSLISTFRSPQANVLISTSAYVWAAGSPSVSISSVCLSASVSFSATAFISDSKVKSMSTLTSLCSQFVVQRLGLHLWQRCLILH